MAGATSLALPFMHFGSSVCGFVFLNFQGMCIISNCSDLNRFPGVDALQVSDEIDPKKWEAVQYACRRNERFFSCVFFMVRETGGYARRY
jgi:hypothetical protein